MDNIPKYHKIELYGYNNKLLETFNDCGMYITGDNLIIIKDSHDSLLNSNISEGIIYELSNLSSYKVYNK